MSTTLTLGVNQFTENMKTLLPNKHIALKIHMHTHATTHSHIKLHMHIYAHTHAHTCSCTHRHACTCMNPCTHKLTIPPNKPFYDDKRAENGLLAQHGLQKRKIHLIDLSLGQISHTHFKMSQIYFPKSIDAC